MSKKDELNNAIKGIANSFIAPQQDIQEVKKEVVKDTEINKETKNKKEVITIKLADNDINRKYKNGVNLNDNYTITFKIDADIEDYLKNIEKIAFIESVKSGKIDSTTRTEFVNDLIRENFYQLINADDEDTAEDINKKWLKYKTKNNL